MTIAKCWAAVEKRVGGRHKIESYRDLLLLLVQKELKVRYQENVLGYLWSVGNPLSFALVYYFAFKVVMQVNVDAYPLVVMSGLFPWQWYSGAVTSAPNNFLTAAAILKKVNFPRHIIPLAATLNHMIHFVFTLPVLIMFVIAYQRPVSVVWLYGFPLQILIQFVTLFGISLMLSSLNLFLRDIERLMQILMRLAFYFTPIIYTTDLIPDRYLKLVPFNPAAPLMINWRELILKGTLDWNYVFISSGYAILFLVIGWWIYSKLSHRFAEVI